MEARHVRPASPCMKGFHTSDGTRTTISAVKRFVRKARKRVESRVSKTGAVINLTGGAVVD